MPVPLAVGLGAKLAVPILAGLFGRRRKLREPRRYVTPEDTAAAEATRARLAADARNTGAGLRVEALRRARQRGLETAPAIEATLGRVGQVEARGVQHAGDVSEEQLYNMGLGNLRFEQQKYLRQMGVNEAKDAAFWNSMIEYVPSIMGDLDTLSASRGAVSEGLYDSPIQRGRRYNPATGSFEEYGPGRGALDDTLDEDYG